MKHLQCFLNASCDAADVTDDVTSTVYMIGSNMSLFKLSVHKEALMQLKLFN